MDVAGSTRSERTIDRRGVPSLTTRLCAVEGGAKGVYDEVGMNVDHEELVKKPTQGLSKSNRPWKTNKQRCHSMLPMSRPMHPSTRTEPHIPRPRVVKTDPASLLVSA